jgi:hypothetical protein
MLWEYSNQQEQEMNHLLTLSRVWVLAVGLMGVCGCSGEPEATQTKEEMREQQLDRARRMEQEAGR